MNKFIRFHRFLKINNIKNIVYFDVPNHYIFKMFQEHSAIFVLELYGQKHKFET
jgi:hypothetical protein